MVDTAAVMSLVNNIRVEAGMSKLDALLPGLIANPCQCPIARSLTHGHDGMLGLQVTRSTTATSDARFAEIVAREFGAEMRIAGDEYEIATSTVFSEFIFEFDLGFYPELVAAS